MVTHQRLHVILLTGRTIEQGVGKEQGKTSKDYFDSASVCFIDPDDLKTLGVNEKANVQVLTAFGSVVVKALQSPQAPHRGIVFIPYGPWANIIVDPETDSVGMPSLKGIPADVEPADDKPLLSFKELLAQEFRKE